jgi:hypothetical protein
MPEQNPHVRNLLDDYLHDLLEAPQAQAVEAHCESCPECRTALDEARHLRSALQAVPPSEASPQLLAAALGRIAEYERRRKARRKTFLWSAAGTLAAGVLVLLGMHVYYYNLKASPYDLIVLGQRELLTASGASLRIRLVDHNDNRPLAGVPVTVALRGGAGEVELANFTTDAQGTGQPHLQLPDWANGRYELHIVAKTPGHPEEVVQTVQLRRSWKLLLSSDKPVYQGGQNIQVRALALRKPDLHPVGEQPTVFTLTDPKGNVLFKKKTATSRYGIAATSCLLDREILDGLYTLACKVGDTESRLAVEVKKYVLPKFKADVTFDRPFYQPGQTVRCTVKADYFFGKPVSRGEVQIEMRPAGAEKALDKQTARTDEKGAAVLTFKLPQNLADDSRVAFQVTVTDSAGQKQERSAERLVTRQPVRIEVLPEAGRLVQGVSNRIYLFVRSADGSPVRARLTVSGVARDLETDKQGLASFEHTPRSRAMGFTVVAFGARGEELARREVALDCGTAANDFLLRTNRAICSAGGTVRLTALGGGREPVFVDFLKDGQTLLTQVVEMTGQGGELAFDLPPELAGTVLVCAYRFGGDGIPIRKTRVLYVRPAAQVKIKATLDAQEYRPGKSAKVNFTLTDAGGAPIPGALSLAAVDEAVFSVLPQKPGMEQTFYLLEKELLKPVYAIYPWSPETEGETLAQAAFSMTVRDEEAIEPGAVGPNATHSLAADSFLTKVQQTAEQREGGLAWVETGWLVWIGLLLASAYIALWLFVRPVVVLALHGIALVMILPVLIATQARYTDRVFEASDRVAFRGAKQAAPRPLPDALVLSAQDATASMRGHNLARAMYGGNAEPRVRELFPETLLWKPELITDDQGHASLDIELADSITTWRLAASAVTADGRLGAAQLPLKVFQPFFADLDLPVSLTRGDEVAMPVVVYNYLDKPQTVTLTLAPGTGLQLQGDAEQRVDLGPGEVRSVRYRLKAHKVGTHELQVTARGSGVADALKRPIEVIPDGRRVEFVQGGNLRNPASLTLDVPANAVEGSAVAFVKIYPSSFSQLVEGLENIFQMPNGCFEQTSSTTYPNVLALDYLRRTNKSVPAVEARARQYIHLGYQRLIGFEVQGGGFDWFGHPPANRTLTAYGLMEFEDMARVHDVDPALIERTRQWLLAQRDRANSWAPEAHMLHDDVTRGGDPEQQRLATTAYIAWAIFANGFINHEVTRMVAENRGLNVVPATFRVGAHEARLILEYLLLHRPEDIRDPHVLVLVCNALLVLSPRGAEAGPYLDRLDALKKTSPDGALVWWEQPQGARTTFYGAGRSGCIETTALAALALIGGKHHPATARAALAWLVAQKDARGTWHSTQATVLSLKALLAGTSEPLGDGERRIEVRLGGQIIRELAIPADQAEVMHLVDLTPHLAAGINRLNLAEKSGSGVGYQVTFRYHLPQEAKPAPEGPLAVSLNYDRTELAVNDAVKATARVENRMKQPAAMVMLDLPVPAGFAAAADDFEALVQKGTIARCQVRPRQILVYLRNLAPGKPLELSYHLRATMPVKVTAPGARAYEYYDPDREGRSGGTRFTVKARD